MPLDDADIRQIFEAAGVPADLATRALVSIRHAPGLTTVQVFECVHAILDDLAAHVPTAGNAGIVAGAGVSGCYPGARG